MSLVVEQHGVGTVIRVIGPAGKEGGRFDGPNGTEGPEPAEWLARTDGTYVVEVLPLDPKAPAGRYVLRSVEVRKATRSELDRARREDALARAEQDWDEAVVRRDVAGIERVAAPDYANFSGLGTAGTRDAFVQGTESARQAGSNPWDHNERTMVTMRFTGTPRSLPVACGG